MNTVQLQNGWLEKEIKRTEEEIKDFRLYDMLDKDKPFQLWTHFQDEPPGIFEGFHTREVAIARGCEYSLNPIIYGTVYLYDKDKFCLGRFENGHFENYTIQYKRINDAVASLTGYEWRGLLNNSNLEKAMDILGDNFVKKICHPEWNDPRPSWDATFISEAFRISRRSLDKHTKCGCVLVKDKRIVSTGYNSPPPGFDDSKADLERPGKYIIFEHGERNAICNAARAGISTLGTTAYITGFPCSDCYRAMWNAGIEKVIYAPVSLEYFTADHIARLPAAKNGPKLIAFSKEQMKEVIKILDDEYDYIMERVFGEVNTPVSGPNP